MFAFTNFCAKNNKFYCTFRQWTVSQGMLSRYYLSLASLKETDAGTYKCTGKSLNVTGDSASFKLNVIGESIPVFLDNFPPKRLILYAGQDFALTCKVSNFHHVNLAWGRESAALYHNTIVSIALKYIICSIVFLITNYSSK